jgi:hypothetical protein
MVGELRVAGQQRFAINRHANFRGSDAQRNEMLQLPVKLRRETALVHANSLDRSTNP